MRAAAMMPHASESQHWYRPDGSPCYEVEAVKGGLRPATLRDARKQGLYPGVSTIIGCCSKPGLEYWKQQQVLHAALTLPLIAGESEEDYLARIMRDSKEQAKKAAERGTAIHASVQAFFEGDQPQEAYWEHCKAAQMEINLRYPGVLSWKAEQSFAHPLGFGGKCDLHATAADRFTVIDFKTKEFDESAKLEAWDEHAMQLAAYREGLGMPQARCAIVYVSVTVPGLARVIEIDQAALVQGWSMFQGLHQYWCAKNKYWPATEKVAA